MAAHPRTRHLPLDPPWPDILADVRRVAGKLRGIGTHCGGVVITPGPIHHHAPVQISAKGVPIVQWEKDGAEEMGLVKIDLLGNRSLAVIRDAIANCRREGIQFDENQWDPASDPRTVALLARGDSIGVFYVESPATRLLQRKSGHGDFDHLVIHSSIIRPAANRLINEYLRRLHGGHWQPEHPALAEALAETYGIMVYQEDVARVAMALAGFDFVEADGLRKVMAKKDRHNRLADYRQRFFDGAARRGVPAESIERVWRMCLSFSGYSFCKPHSASYVQVSFQSAWLKAHYPAAFMAAVISNYGGFYVTQAYVSEAQRLGIAVLTPDVNESLDRYYSRGRTIRVGLCQIKGLSEQARRRVVEERERGGRYARLTAFFRRTGIEEADAERLILAGACDSVEPATNRPRQFWIMRCYYRRVDGDHHIPSLKDYSPRRLLRAQYAMLGFLTDYHPLQLIPCPVPNAIKIKDIARRRGKRVTFFGWCITSKTVSTKFGESMQFVTFEDETGVAETVLFPEAYQKFVHLLGWKEAFVVRGTVVEESGAITVEVDQIQGVQFQRRPGPG
jgi:DNA polymerase-3 subunit alpha/error-prone DNA polymerase